MLRPLKTGDARIIEKCTDELFYFSSCLFEQSLSELGIIELDSRTVDNFEDIDLFHGLAGIDMEIVGVEGDTSERV